MKKKRNDEEVMKNKNEKKKGEDAAKEEIQKKKMRMVVYLSLSSSMQQHCSGKLLQQYLKELEKMAVLAVEGDKKKMVAAAEGDSIGSDLDKITLASYTMLTTKHCNFIYTKMDNTI